MLDDFIAFTPINFFQISADCHQTDGPIAGQQFNKYKLPSTSGLAGEDKFADVAMGWSKQGLYLSVRFDKPQISVCYPDFQKGDSVELFIDTRDVKTSGFNTRFCHHFFFLPEPIEGRQAGEITRFRTEDSHELCDPKDLSAAVQKKSDHFFLQIYLPIQSLYGYDSDQFDRLGFSYRINRSDGPPQHFSVLSEDYQVEQQPSLWSSLKLVK